MSRIAQDVLRRRFFGRFRSPSNGGNVVELSPATSRAISTSSGRTFWDYMDSRYGSNPQYWRRRDTAMYGGIQAASSWPWWVGIRGPAAYFLAGVTRSMLYQGLITDQYDNPYRFRSAPVYDRARDFRPYVPYGFRNGRSAYYARQIVTGKQAQT